MELPDSTPVRTIGPRKPKSNADRPIIAVSVRGETWLDENGETGELQALSGTLRKHSPTIFACDHAAELLGYLHHRHSFDPHWQFQIMPLEREVFRANGVGPGKGMALLSTMVSYFGWKTHTDSEGHTRSPSRYHLALDPVTFSNFALKRGSDDKLTDLLRWASDLRQFCLDEQINLKPTQGATSRQFLRDPRFYPEKRRKVPRSTNERVRKALPGNDYMLKVAKPNVTHPSCLYIDQSRAHHTHAASITFPNANSLMAFGNFRGEHTKPWKTDRVRIADFILGFHGMVVGKLKWKGHPYTWSPKYLEQDGTCVWYSSDIGILADLRVECTQIDAAWGSHELDLGLNAYASWAIDRLGDDPPPWLKTLLLSTYGTLAARARKHSYGYAQSKGKEVQPELIRAGKQQFTALMHTTKHELEPSTNNVLHRALIEAATRTESLMLANHLARSGWQTLAIYADALIVRDLPSGRIPNLPPPWRIKEHLHNVQFISSNAFVSDEMSKVPGGMDRRQRIQVARAEFATHRRPEKTPIGRLAYGLR